MIINLLSQKKFYKEHKELKSRLLAKGYSIKDYGPYTCDHNTTFDTLSDNDNMLNPFKQIKSDLLLVLEAMHTNEINKDKFPNFCGEKLLILSDESKVNQYIHSPFFQRGFYNLHCKKTILNVTCEDNIDKLLSKC